MDAIKLNFNNEDEVTYKVNEFYDKCMGITCKYVGPNKRDENDSFETLWCFFKDIPVMDLFRKDRACPKGKWYMPEMVKDAKG